MSYGLSNKKLDIGGPKGNVFAVLGIAMGIVKQVEGKAASKTWAAEAFDLDNSSYEDVLRAVIAKTGITLIASHDIGIDPSLYTIEDNEYL